MLCIFTRFTFLSLKPIHNSEFKIHNLPIPPLAQACSLCPIRTTLWQTSRVCQSFSTPCWRELVARAQFKIQNSPRWRKLAARTQFTILSPSYLFHLSHKSHNRPCGSHPIAPQFKIQNSKFRIPAAGAQFTIPNS